MKNAPIIILDEATANVDTKNEKELVEAIGRSYKGKNNNYDCAQIKDGAQCRSDCC